MAKIRWQPACVVGAVTILAIVTAPAQAAQRRSTPQTTPRPPPVSETAPRYFAALKLSPAGDALALVAPTKSGGQRWVEVRDLRVGSDSRLPGTIAWTFAAEPYALERKPGHRGQLAWSPDGRSLAYVAQDEGRQLRIWIWDRAAHKAQAISGVTACGDARDHQPSCFENVLEWSPDGSSLYFLGTVLPAEPMQPRPKAGERPADPTLPSRHALPSPPANALPNFRYPADAYRYDLPTGSLARLTYDGELEFLALAPDGNALLVAQRSPAAAWQIGGPKQDYLDYFVIPFGAPPAEANDAARSGTTLQPAPGYRLHPIAGRARQRYPLASWSPDGERLALIEHGAATDGDVVVYDRHTARGINLTSAMPVSNEARQASRYLPRHALYPGAKFGGGTNAPVWSRDGSRIGVLRRESVGGRWSTSLWAIDIRTLQISILLRRPDCDVTAAWASAAKSTRSFQALAYCGDGATFLLSEDEQDLRVAPPGSDRPLLATISAKGDAAFVIQARDSAGEAYLYRPHKRSARQATALNARLAAPQRGSEIVRWQSGSGLPLWATLYAPNAQAKTMLPVVIDLYPSDASEIELPRRRFAAGDGALRPYDDALISAGYAVLVPNLPVAGAGRSCAQLAGDVALLVATLRRLPRIDVDRAFIIGHSFGGWSTLCLAGRLDLFRGAISIAGVSDLVSAQYSGVGRTVTRGGGQVNIGADIEQRPDLYWQESPIARADQIRMPILLIHGKRDATVPFEQSVEMANALSDRGKQVELLLFPERGHGDILGDPQVTESILRWIDAQATP